MYLNVTLGLSGEKVAGFMRFFGAGGKINNNGFPHLGHDLGQSEASFHRFQYLANQFLDTASDYTTTVSVADGGITAQQFVFGTSTMDERGIIYSARIGLVNGTLQHYQIDSNTDTIGLFDVGLTSEDDYGGEGLCATVNGLLYSAGRDGLGNYIKIDTKTNPITVTKYTLSNFTSSKQPTTPVRNNQGIVYQCPYGTGHDRIWKIDPYTDTVTEIGVNFNTNSTFAWNSYAFCPENNCIYGIYNRGLNNNNVLKIDTNTDTVSLVNSGLRLPNSTDGCYWGATYDLKGKKVWFFPTSIKFQIASLDPNNNDAVTTHGTYSGANGPRYLGACLGLDGKIYSPGWAFNNFWVYDIATNTRSQVGSLGVNNAYMGQSAILGKNGKIYLFPFAQSNGIGTISPGNNETYDLPINYLIHHRNSH